MKRIFLVGYMGSGKTTVGKQLAKSLSLTFIDLDAYIRNRYRKSIPELFRERGEDGFRKIEHEMMQEVSCFEDVVIATGGGTPCFFDNMELMNRAGITIYIRAAPEELAARLFASKNVRPLIAGKPKEKLIPFISQHLMQRERYYNMAQIVRHTDRMITKEELYSTVDAIVAELKNREI